MASKVITRDEFQKHISVGDCWIEIEGSVYDVSEWMKKHPGGERVIECLGGRDASLPFLLNHQPWVRERYLKSMLIGILEPKLKANKYDALTTDFIDLYNQLMAKGWFETSYAYYAKKVMVLFGMLIGAIYCFHLARFYDLSLFAWMGSFIVGMFWQQIAFIGHDLGHNGITHDVWWDTFLGFFIGNFGQGMCDYAHCCTFYKKLILSTGISLGWWKYTHNVHHIRTNDSEWDPDIQHMPFVAISKQYLEKVYSFFHRHYLPPTDRMTAVIAKFLIKFQHFHWFFTIMLSRLFVYMSSIIFVFYQQPKRLNGKNEPYRFYNEAEQLSLVGYHVWTIALFYFCTDSPAFYYFIAYATAGILHIQIIMNHFPCPIFDDIEEDNFVVHQLRSSMAISSNTMTHWFYGGLQFQVEHHLFPMMPRHNLRKVKPYILALCKKYDLPYLENTFWGAVFDIFYILKDVAQYADKINELNFLAKTS